MEENDEREEGGERGREEGGRVRKRRRERVKRFEVVAASWR